MPASAPTSQRSNSKRVVCLGVAGGTGSGKTTVAEAIVARIGSHQIAYLQQDSYYRDLSHLPPEERPNRNFDHPEALESEMLVAHVRSLKTGQPVEVPVYDFTRHVRTGETKLVEPRKVILVEGILIFAEKALREEFDIRIFVDTDPDIRFIRRLRRDLAERGRTVESVINQYLATVRPMHLEFVEPSKRWADVIIPEGGFNTVALDMVCARVETWVRSDAP